MRVFCLFRAFYVNGILRVGPFVSGCHLACFRALCDVTCHSVTASRLPVAEHYPGVVCGQAACGFPAHRLTHIRTRSALRLL